MKQIKITDDRTVLRAVLNDTAAAQDFEKRLPLSLSGYDSGIDYCCNAASGLYDPTQTQTGWKNGDLMKNAKLVMTQEWDKTFPKSDKVNHSKVTFHNRYGIMLAADMYVPKNAEGKLPAIAVCGPFGAVKEQCNGFYA